MGGEIPPFFKTMCLYPRLMLNRKYTNTRKNNYNPPALTDERLKWVSVGCGQCIECRKQKAQAWRIRLCEEIKQHEYNYFVTLTFAPEELEKLCQEKGMGECNAIAGFAVRRFLERYRKKYKTSVKHWLITEMGQDNTERIHLHGLIMRDIPLTNEELSELWKYGVTDNGKYVNVRTINYIIKYVTKIDETHKGFVPQIFCSAGIGKTYLRQGKLRNAYKGADTKETYVLNTGARVNLPIYYRNHLYTEEQREKLWIDKIEKHTIFVMGCPVYNIDTLEGHHNYMDILRKAQEENQRLGYGSDDGQWKQKDYNVTLRMINKQKKDNTCGAAINGEKKSQLE